MITRQIEIEYKVENFIPLSQNLLYFSAFRDSKMLKEKWTKFSIFEKFPASQSASFTNYTNLNEIDIITQNVYFIFINF